VNHVSAVSTDEVKERDKPLERFLLAAKEVHCARMSGVVIYQHHQKNLQIGRQGKPGS
jgi:hypothetical protein